MFTDSEWPTNTGTRTQVAVSLILGSRIFLGLHHHLPLFLGVAVLHEHVDLRMTLKAIRFGNFFETTSLP